MHSTKAAKCSFIPYPSRYSVREVWILSSRVVKSGPLYSYRDLSNLGIPLNFAMSSAQRIVLKAISVSMLVASTISPFLPDASPTKTVKSQ